MKNLFLDSIKRIASFNQCTTLFSLITVFMFAQMSHGQMKNTEHKADKNLKSSARINPSTLAMEFTLPLGGYPGRSGNAFPFSLSYSSKVWHRKSDQPVTKERSLVGQQPYDYDLVTALFSTPRFSRRTISGWSSSLQAPAIIKELEFYNQFGEIHTFSPPSVDAFGSTSLTGCRSECHSGIVFNTGCGGFAIYYGCAVCCDDNFCVLIGDIEITCLGGEPGGGGGGGPNPTPLPTPIIVVPTPTPEEIHIVERLRVHMPDGSSQEFRKQDSVNNCTTNPANCGNYQDGTYLSVNGNGQVLKIGDTSINNERRAILYLPDGSRYVFLDLQFAAAVYLQSSYLIDRNGNQSTFDSQSKTWQDNMGRSLVDPLPNPLNFESANVSVKEFTLPGMNTSYRIKWKNLRNRACVNGNEPECSDTVLENGNQELKYLGNDACQNVLRNDPVAPALFSANPAEMWAGENANARYLTSERMCAMTPWSGSGTPPQPPYSPVKFNPVVMAEVDMPNGQKYQFKYNEYGEITKIIYPTGGYERFRYDAVSTIGGSGDQTNRGVVEHWVSEDGTNVTQNWTYVQSGILYNNAAALQMTANAPDGSKSVRVLRESYQSTAWGFSDPLAGMPLEERAYDTANALRSRTINDWIVQPARTGGDARATRDPRAKRSVSIMFEPGSNSALATLSETEYDDAGSTDPTYFSHLNVKRQKGYHYAVIQDKTTVDNEQLSWETIQSWFPADKLASVSETDYSYDPNYKARGIIGLPIETRVLNPANPSDVLAKSQVVYDEAAYFDNSYTTTGWVDPLSNLRGNATTAKTWVKETDTWLETHTMFDNFGNVRKVWDASNDPNKFVETQYDPIYKYAYPTKVIAPAPDPTGITGTNQTSTAETVYDFTTGLPLSVKDDFGQITKTEYDGSLRPVRVFADNFTAPESQTIYGIPNASGQLSPDQRFVKVRKQIDATNWDEAVTWFDGLGRTIKTQAKDSQGDVFGETKYDAFGRVDKVSNPYRQGEMKLWTTTTYDQAGRLKFVTSPDGAKIETQYDLATAGSEIGMATIVMDQAGKSRRSIINALQQLIRVDEPNDQNQLGAIDAPNQPTKYEYDGLNNLKKVIQGIQTRSFSYNSLSRLLSATNPESGTTNYGYDNNGNLLTKTDARGITTNFAYDRLNRIKTRSYAGEQGYQTPQVSYYYDGVGATVPFGKGRLTKVLSSVSETRYNSFDNLGRVLSSSQITDGQTYNSGYLYNLSGALIEQTYPSGRVVKNTLDVDGDLSQVQSRKANGTFQNYANSFSYTAAGAVSSMRLGNGKWESTQFNSRLQPTQIALGGSAGNANLLKLDYSYGTTANNGNVQTQTITVPTVGSNQGFVATQNYTYDSLNRIKQAAETIPSQTGWQQTFQYDKFGNRRFDTANNATTTLTPNCQVAVCNPEINSTNNRLIGYGFDTSGNTTQDANGQTFVYDAENKQVQVNNASGIVGQYFYDGDGRRIKKIVPSTGETTVFVYDASNKMVAEYSTIVASPSEAKISYLTNDHLGSPRITTDALGQVISRRDFHPFGEEIARANYGSDNIREKFATYERDAETDLDFAQARMYNKNHGRFTAVDPLMVSADPANPQTWNRYIYVINNPLVMIDPTGEIGDYYDKNGSWLFTDNINDDKVYLATPTAIADGGTNYEVQDLGITHTQFKIASSIVKQEGATNDTNEYLYIAHASNNEAQATNRSLYGLLMSSFSSVPNKTALSTKDGSLRANAARAGVIDVLSGGSDPTSGARRWDGTDFLAWGLNSPNGTPHNKFEEFDSIVIREDVFNAYLGSQSANSIRYGGRQYAIPADVFNRNKNPNNWGSWNRGGRPESGFRYSRNNGRGILYATGTAGKSIFWSLNRWQ